MLYEELKQIVENEYRKPIQEADGSILVYDQGYGNSEAHVRIKYKSGDKLGHIMVRYKREYGACLCGSTFYIDKSNESCGFNDSVKYIADRYGQLKLRLKKGSGCNAPHICR